MKDDKPELDYEDRSIICEHIMRRTKHNINEFVPLFFVQKMYFCRL